jgi:pilus assembly protein CpaF
MSRQAIYDASLEFFLRPILPFLRDESVTEVMVNGHDRVYIERRGRIELTNAEFESEDALLSAVHNIAQYVGRQVSAERPILDARLPGGSRVHAVLPPSARGGIYLTIRKFSKEVFTLEKLVELGSLSEVAREFLEICVRLKKNIIISGGTGTGKTVFLGALSRAIPEEERIIVIEDTSELRLIQEHCLYLEVQQPDQYGRGGLSVRQLFVASLRMRPDRIIVGEVRGGEALDLMQSLLSGHAGSLSTVHANSARDALVRLETLSLMSDVELPVYVARAQVAAAVDLVVQLARFTEDGSRRVTRISEVLDLTPQGQYQVQDLFVSRVHGRCPDGSLIVDLEPTGKRPTFARDLFDQGMEALVDLTGNLWSD